MIKYFKVTAKFGHVGRNKYYEAAVYIEAQTAKEAALQARLKPRVKHNHKDAILSVDELDYQEFICGQALMRENPYFGCRSVQEQRFKCPDLCQYIMPEKRQKNYKNKGGYKRKQAILHRLQRKSDKYRLAVYQNL